MPNLIVIARQTVQA